MGDRRGKTEKKVYKDLLSRKHPKILIIVHIGRGDHMVCVCPTLVIFGSHWRLLAYSHRPIFKV